MLKIAPAVSCRNRVNKVHVGGRGWGWGDGGGGGGGSSALLSFVSLRMCSVLNGFHVLEIDSARGGGGGGDNFLYMA